MTEIGTASVVLAYSGGLDISVAIGWIAEATGARGGGDSRRRRPGWRGPGDRPQARLACGSLEAYVADAKDEFAEEYCLPALKANGQYMDCYPRCRRCPGR